MINGSPFAPFRHDSTWPPKVLTWFRKAVYYRHVHVPGRDSIALLRELAKMKSNRRSKGTGEWSYLKDACDSVVHSAVSENVSDENMSNLATNLLIFANLILIGEYGLEARVRIRHESSDEAKHKKEEAGAEAARQKFLDSINDAYESLESAVDVLRNGPKRTRGNHGKLRLSGQARVLSAIPSTHHLVKPGGDIKIVVHLPNTDACGYYFHPHDPVGWVMSSGRPATDRFADDFASSKGVWGQKRRLMQRKGFGA